MIKRDFRIDIMRTFAIFSIFLAHSIPPGWIFELRNFDVIMMSFIMGASYYLSQNNKRKGSFLNYIKKRFKRLILPSWLFTSLFMVSLWIISKCLNSDFYFSFNEILGYFALLQGHTFLWIMSVFFVMSLALPVFNNLNNKINSNFIYFIMVTNLYIIYHLVVIFIPQSGITALLINNYIVLSFGYLIAALIGLRIYKLNSKNLNLLVAMFLIIFIIIGCFNNFHAIQNAKYPPTLYYISYGLFVSCLMFTVLDLVIDKEKSNKYIIWVSTKTFNLYMYHIIALQIIGFIQSNILFINSNFLTRFIFIFSFSIIFSILEEFIKRKLLYKIRQKNTKKVINRDTSI